MQENISKNKKWIRPFQLAKIKGVSNQTVYRWIREGKLEAKKIKVCNERLVVGEF